MKRDLIKLGFCVLTVVFVFFIFENFSPQTDSFLFLFCVALLIISGILYLYLLAKKNEEFRQSPSFWVYLLAVIFFGTPQFLFGVVGILIVLAASFPFGIFTLHKTLPAVGSHLTQAFRWPGARRAPLEGATHAVNTVEVTEQVQPSQRAKVKDKKIQAKQKEGAIYNGTQVIGQEIKDYAAYIESLSKRH